MPGGSVAMGLKVDAKKFPPLLKLDEIDVDTDGEITGLDEQLDTSNDQFRELFDARRLKDDEN